MTENPPISLYENPGWGSAIVEAQLVWYGLPHRLIPAGDVYDDPAAHQALRAINPTAQIPTMVLPDGQVMTESAAMTLLLADLAQSDALVPGPQAPERAAFLRWLIYLVAQIYPTFAFGDVPTRFVPEDQADAYQARVIAHRMALWRAMEPAAQAPWFLGTRFSAIDIYLAVMVHWRPREAWFAAETPNLSRIAAATAALPQLAPVMARNFAVEVE